MCEVCNSKAMKKAMMKKKDKEHEEEEGQEPEGTPIVQSSPLGIFPGVRIVPRLCPLTYPILSEACSMIFIVKGHVS